MRTVRGKMKPTNVFLFALDFSIFFWDIKSLISFLVKLILNRVSLFPTTTVCPTPKLTNYIEFFFIVGGGEGILRTFFFLKLHYQSFFVSRCYRDTKLTNLHLVVVCNLKITGLHSYLLRSVSMLACQCTLSYYEAYRLTNVSCVLFWKYEKPIL